MIWRIKFDAGWLSFVDIVYVVCVIEGNSGQKVVIIHRMKAVELSGNCSCVALPPEFIQSSSANVSIR